MFNFDDKHVSLKRPTTSADITDGCSESKRLCTDDDGVGDGYFDEPPPILESPNDEPVSVCVLKNVTAAVPTDFTKAQPRVQNYGYDFRVLDYFDVEPNYNSSVLQQPIQPVLCPVVNGTLTSNKNVLTDDVADIYFNNTSNTTSGEIADSGEDSINTENVDGRYKCKTFGFTKTKRNYISMYLNINNVPVLCNTCFGLKCVCNE